MTEIANEYPVWTSTKRPLPTGKSWKGNRIKRILKSKINVGDYFIRLIDNKIIMRVTGQVPYSKAADYIVYTVQKVTGDTIDDTEKLEVKEGYFAWQ